MTMTIDIAEVSPALVDDLANNGGEITLTRDGKPVAKLVRVESDSTATSNDERVLYKGEWMSAAGAERERSLERLHGSVKIHGDIVSPIYENDGPMAGTIILQGDIVSPVSEDKPVETAPRANGRVLYKGEWMSAAGAERERAMERFHGSVKILGDIVSPIDDLEYDALK